MTAVAPARALIDENQFAEYHRLYSRMVSSVIYRIIGNSPDIDDLAQKVWLLAYSRLAQFGNRSQFSSWLHSIARNVAVAYLRDSHRPSNLPFTCEAGLDLASHEEDPEEIFSRIESDAAKTELVGRLMRGLPPQFQRAVYLEYFEDLSQNESAEILGITRNALKIRLFRAKRFMAKRAAILAKGVAEHKARMGAK